MWCFLYEVLSHVRCVLTPRKDLAAQFGSVAQMQSQMQNLDGYLTRIYAPMNIFKSEEELQIQICKTMAGWILFYYILFATLSSLRDFERSEVKWRLSRVWFIGWILGSSMRENRCGTAGMLGFHDDRRLLLALGHGKNHARNGIQTHFAHIFPGTWWIMTKYDQRKFRSSNFRLYWKLPVALAASMFSQQRCFGG